MNEITNNVLCDQIRDLLIRSAADDLTDRERHLLTEHLESCEQCRTYQEMLNKLPVSLAVPKTSGLLPDPAIYRMAVKRLKERAAFHIRPAESITDYVISLLNHRIPVYQMILGMALIIMVFSTFERTDYTGYTLKGYISENVENNKLITIFDDSLLNIFNINKRQVGISLQDDTVLTQLTVKAM